MKTYLDRRAVGAKRSEKSMGEAEGRGWRAETGNGGGARGGDKRGPGKSICDNIPKAREVDEVAGEFRDEGQIAVAAGRTRAERP